MEKRINNRFFRKILLIGVLSFFATVTLMGQTLQGLHNAIERGMSPSSRNAQWAFNSLFAHRNNRCSSGSVFVIRLYASNNGNITAYYCENEDSEYKSVCNELAKSHWRFESGVIDNSNGGGSSNQPSAADIEAEKQRQAEIERQQEQARLEQQRKFEQDKQGLLADLKGMTQEVTKPLELMGGVQTSTNSLELIGMGQTPATNDLELIGVNPSNDKAMVTVSPGQGVMTPDQLERELNMSRTAYELAMQQINNYEKNNSALQKEISELTTKNKNTDKIIVYGYEKNIAILDYQSTMVAYYNTLATQEGSMQSWNEYLAEKENILKTQYGLTKDEINQLRQEANNALKTGVPTLGIIDMDPVDKASLIDMDLTTIPKVGKALDAGANGMAIGEPIAAGIIELAYSNPKNEFIDALSKIKEKINANKRLIESKQTELDGLMIEYDRLQKVFQKYGKDILESNDDAKIIQFGNECRNALNIRIEERNY